VTLSLPGTRAQKTRTSCPSSSTARTPQICAAPIDGISGGVHDRYGPRATPHTSWVTHYRAILKSFRQRSPRRGVNGFGVGGPSHRTARTRCLRRHRESHAHEPRCGLFGTDAGRVRSARSSPPNIGGNLLRRFTITFDYRNGTMALVPITQRFTTRTCTRLRSFSHPSRRQHVCLIDARPGTPARSAGIAKGDVIASIDGSPAGGMSLGRFATVFLPCLPPAGTVVTLQITGKDAAQRTVKLTPRRLHLSEAA